MNTLVRDVLMLSRVGRDEQPTERVSLDALVARIVERSAEALEARKATVTCHPLGEIRAVPTHVDQLFSNLIGNGVKYGRDGIPPVVEVGRVERGGTVEYYVRDNGIGIDPAYHAKVFEAFQRLKEVEAEGTGVGLAIVKKIVESAGGRLRIESAAGAGATFFFTWPQGGGALPEAP
jgi:signal transduction histidine kinase